MTLADAVRACSDRDVLAEAVDRFCPGLGRVEHVVDAILAGCQVYRYLDGDRRECTIYLDPVIRSVFAEYRALPRPSRYRGELATERRRGVRFVDASGDTHYHEMNPLEHPHYLLLVVDEYDALDLTQRHPQPVVARQVAYRREYWHVPEGPLVSPIPYVRMHCNRPTTRSLHDPSLEPEYCVREVGHPGPCSPTHVDRCVDVVYREETP